MSSLMALISTSVFFQVARHTSRILPVGGEAAEESGDAPSPPSTSSVPALSSHVTSDEFATAAVAMPVLPVLTPKAPAASVVGVHSKYAANSIPPNVLAELQVCNAFICNMRWMMRCSIF